MLPPIETLDPLLPPDGFEALLALARASGPYRPYVEEPKAGPDGLGAGLTRRHDAALNFVREIVGAGDGGSMEDLAARTNLFRGTWAERGAPPLRGCEPVLHHPAFLQFARSISGLPLVQPYMLYVNLLLPGQQLAVHLDTPEFRGLAKGSTPEWLLVVCAASGLFDAWRIPVVSAVAFLEPCVAGELRVWPAGRDGAREGVQPRPNTAVVLDADRIHHGVARVGGPDAPAPPARIGHALRWQDDRWLLLDGDRLVASHPPGEVRVSLQWKARCFADEAARDAAADGREPLTVRHAVDTLVADLRARGELAGALFDGTDLALKLIDAYVPFPDRANLG